jgi:hypothetical protein
MLPSALLCLALAGTAGAQEPFQPLNLERQEGVLSKEDAQRTWVRLTNQQLELSGKAIRVATEGFTAVILAPQVEKARQAKPMLLGKNEYQVLFRSIVGMGFTRLVVRNPDLGREWAARLERGKAVLED